ncbi:MAG: hypothetical protein ABW003_14580 [Microvirga sp.]
MADVHPVATKYLPAFITAPGDTDVLMVAVTIILVVSVLGFGSLFFRLHTLPERMAHKSHKLQFEIVAVLGLLALFTHIHLFWVAGLLLALIDIPDFGARSLSRIAGSTEKMAGLEPGGGTIDAPSETIVEDKRDDGATNAPTQSSSKHEGSSKEKEVVHA